MTKLHFILFFLTLFCISTNVQANIDADLDVITYYQDQSPFIEVNLHIVGSSLTEKKLEQGMIQTRANILITVLKEENIIDFKKYGLISPSAASASDFIDLKRFSIQPGDYTVKVELSDQLNSGNTLVIEKKIMVVGWQDSPFSSTTKLLYNVEASEDQSNAFFKYGFVLYPTAFSFFHREMNELFVFKEFYSLSSFEENSIASKITVINKDSKEFKPLIKYKKLKSVEKDVIIEKIDISEIVSGNYEVKVELINSKNEVLLSDSILFQRSNPVFDAEMLSVDVLDIDKSFVGKLSDEEISYNLKALSPTLPQSEVAILNILFDEENIEGQKFYLFNYWNNYNPVQPEVSFNQFWEIAKAVDVMYYSTIGRGFETDRGYIFLRYGRPNSVITVENEPSAPPYEIWFYDQLDLTGETNVKFLFYNPSLGGGNFELLHSTTRYERQNKQWEVVLYSDAVNDIEGNSIDATTVVDHVNRRARDYFEDNN